MSLAGGTEDSHLDGPYYQERSAVNYLENIDVPVLAVLAGAGIMLHSAGMLRGFSKIKAKPFKVVVGPGSPGMHALIYWAFYELDNHTDPVPGPDPAWNSVYHDRLRPSHLTLPVITDPYVVQQRPEPIF